MDQTLLEDELDDLEGGLACHQLGMDVGVEDGLEVDLDHGGSHPGRHVAHLLQVLLLSILFP